PPTSHHSARVLSEMASFPTRRSSDVRHGAFGLFELFTPASHCSPLIVSTMPLPQVSFDLQSPEQPSPDTLLPSSQTSPFVVSTIPSQQRCGLQFLRHVAFGRCVVFAP